MRPFPRLKTVFVDRLRHRMLDRSRRGDYLLAFAVACVPVAHSLFLGVGFSARHADDTYKGYLESQWLLFVLILPLTLYVFRAIMSRLLDPDFESDWPPVVGLLHSRQSDEVTRFRNVVASKSSLLFAAVAALAISALDVAEVLCVYVEYWTQPEAAVDPREKDWAYFFVTGRVSPASNLGFIFLAYAVQALVFLLAIWLVCLFAKHNLYFLTSIYGRQRDGRAARDSSIVMNLRHRDRCFGFHDAYRAFNTQVYCLVIAGVVMLVSRYPNTGPNVASEVRALVKKWLAGNETNFWTLVSSVSIGKLLPSDIGQWMLIGAWLVAVIVVALPGLVKFWPIARLLLRKRKLTAVNYIREITPDCKLGWENEEPTRKELEGQLNAFATNSFWPTGDTKAENLFFFAFVVLGFLLVPLRYDPDSASAFVIYSLFVASTAYLFVKALFAIARWPLKYIDPRLTGRRA